MQTKKEFSSGGVVYKQVQSSKSKVKNHFLLGKHSGYHKWVLPKGLIEKGETPEETAVRETEEEMGVMAEIESKEPILTDHYVYFADYKEKVKTTIQNSKIDTDTRRVEKYSEQGGEGVRVEKTVTFYLMKYVSGDPKEHGWEMEDAGWFEYDKCLEMMSFEGEKKALEKAMLNLKISG